MPFKGIYPLIGLNKLIKNMKIKIIIIKLFVPY